MTRKYRATMSATEKAQQLFGVKGNHAQVANTLSQWLQKAVESAVNGDERIFDNVSKNIRIITDRYTGMIMDVTTLPFDGKEAPLFNGQYKMTNHSAQRAQERFGMDREHAYQYFNDLLRTAIWHSTTAKNRHLYEHKSGVRIVVDTDTHDIVTVYKPELASEKAATRLTIDRIAAAVKRELTRMTTQYRREIRKLSEQQAQLGVQVAELTLNKIRCYHPGTQALIQSRIDEARARIAELANEIDGKLTQLQNAEQEVQAVVGE